MFRRTRFRCRGSVPTFSPPAGLRPTSPASGEVKVLLPFGEEIGAEAANFGVDALEIGFVGLAETRGVDRVRPHHDGVFAVVRVVPLAAPDDLETEALVHLHGVFVRR